MKKRINLRTFAMLCLSASILACSLFTIPGSASGNIPQQTSLPTPTQQTQSACDNSLYPVKQGATWTYNAAGGTSGAASYTNTITSVRTDGFTLTSQFKNLTRSQEWQCEPEGLLALQIGSGLAAALNSNGVDAQFTTNKAEGVTIPVTVSTGSQWKYSLDYQGQVTLPQSQPATAAGSANYQLQALGNETVTVPAGTFNAEKIQVNVHIRMQVSVQGINVPVDLIDLSTVWYAPGVGEVKMVDNINVNFFKGTITTELQSYKIP